MSTLQLSVPTSPEAFINSLNDPERAGVKRKADAQDSEPSPFSGFTISKRAPAIIKNNNKLQSQLVKEKDDFPARTVQVSGLKADFLRKKILEVYFRNTKRSGGGPIASIAVEEKHGTARVTFQSAEDARTVAQKGAHFLGGCVLMVHMEEGQQGPKFSGKNLICTGADSSGLDVPMTALHSKQIQDNYSALVKSVSPVGLLDALFSHGCLAPLDINAIRNQSVDEQIVEKLLDIICRKPDQCFDEFVDALCKTGQTHCAGLLVEGETSMTIKISGSKKRLVLTPEIKASVKRAAFALPEEDAPSLITFIRQYADIESVTKGCIALTVKCRSSEDLRNLMEAIGNGTLQKLFHESFLKDNELVTGGAGPDDVKMWIEPIRFDPDDSERSVIVEGFDPDVTSDILELIFEDFDETGGGPIEKIKMNKPGSALITFKEVEVSERVLQRPQTVCTLPVVVRRPPSIRQHLVLDQPEASRCVKVSGLDKTILSKKVLELFFKNKEKSDGGPVVNVDLNKEDGTAIVVFESAEDAQRVAEKGQHSLGGCDLTTTLVPVSPPGSDRRETDEAGSAEKESSQGMAAAARFYKQPPSAAASQASQWMAPQHVTHITEVQDALQQQQISHTSMDTSVSSKPVSDIPRAATSMSEEDKDLLNSQLPQLMSHISIADGMLLAHLRSRGVLTKYGEEKIKSKRDKNSQVRCLLDLLLRGDSNTVDKLIYSLRDTSQSHVADEWLRQPRQLDSWEQIDTKSAGFGATTYLSEADTKLLERHRPRMMADLNLADGNLLAELRTRGVLTENEEWFIQGITGTANAVAYLVDLLLRKSPDSLEGFLNACNQSGYSSVVDYLRPSTASIDKTHFVRGELQKSVGANLADRLLEWKTALESGIGQAEPLHYIDQPCSVKTKDGGKFTVDGAIQIVEDSTPGDRIVVYGEAGMGKTTLLRELARSWIERENRELVTKFQYLFLIPCRLVGNLSLLNIICEELKLLPTSHRSELEKSLDLNEKGILFLIDSFEELRGDVARAGVTDLNDLISSRLFTKSTVIVTSRPGSGPRQSEHQKTAHLKDLPREKVKEVIREQFGEDKKAVDGILKSFSTMSLLQKPINLALFLFKTKHSKRVECSSTQAELLSFVLQYIMLAFARKRKLKEFTPQPGPYILNRDIPRDIRRLFRDIAKRCFEERKKNNAMLQLEEVCETKEYLDFGLFTAGTDANTVFLPHPLFQEYLAAAHLAEDPKALKALFKEIKEKSENTSDGDSESESDRPLLVDVLRPMGMDNVVRFLVALKPQVCERIGKLFVVERVKVDDCDSYQPVNFKYYAELLHECSDGSGKRILATALLNAPVRDGVRYGTESGLMTLWPHLTDDQRVTFLRKVYSFDLRHFDDKFVMSSPGVQITDTFVLTFVYLYNCTISTDKLIIKGEENCYLDLPAGMLSRNISTVRQLRLGHCTLCEGLPQYMSDIDRPATLRYSLHCRKNSSLERVELQRVKGLEYCDVIASCECQLMVEQCADVRVSVLETCFPRVSELELGKDTTVVHETEEELRSWLSTVQTVRNLKLAPQHDGESLSLCRLLNILPEKEDLEYLKLHRYTLLLDVNDTSDTVKQNNTLSGLELEDCKVDVGQFLEVCSHQCPHLRKVAMGRSKLVFDDERVESVKQLPGLQEFTLSDSAVHTPAGRRLGEAEVKQLLHRLCPSAGINVWINRTP